MPNKVNDDNGANNDSNHQIAISNFDVFLEKMPGKGEDALFYSIQDQFSVIAVFDGIGGAGGRIYEVNGENHTEAYFASRLAKKVFNELFQKNTINEDNFYELTSILKKELSARFSQFANRHLTNKSALKGAIVQHLPTTLASWVVLENRNSKKSRMKSLWAGDSRCYVLNQRRGLIQISKDDLINDVDPLNNLEADAPMSNYITSDKEFVINEINLDKPLNQPIIVMVATDGVFHYFPTPMHFEYFFLKTMQNAKDGDDWKTKLSEVISSNTADDASLVWLTIGWDTFSELKAAFSKRIEYVENTYIKPYEKILRQIIDLNDRLSQLTSEHNDLKQQLWKDYRKKYEF